jgi:hypothetical protein
VGKPAETNISRTPAVAGRPTIAPSIAAAVAPAIAAAKAARLPAFDPGMTERLPNATSRVAFMDKWVNRRIDEATATTTQIDERLAQLQRAQGAMQKLGESLRTDMAAVVPTMELLQRAQETAQSTAKELGQSIARNVEQITREQVEATRAESRQAVQNALAPVEQECAVRLEAMLQEADTRMDAAAKSAVTNIREELRQMQEQWLATAQRVRDSLNETLAVAQASASQLAETIEKTLTSAGQAAEALARHAIRAPEIPAEVAPAIDWPPLSPAAKAEDAAEAEAQTGKRPLPQSAAPETEAAERRLPPRPAVKVVFQHPAITAGENAIRALDAASAMLNRAA